MPSVTLRRPQDLSGLAWVGASVAGFLALGGLERHFVADDDSITTRYADNLAGGLGCVWNAGGPRVEGFSNPALVLAEAAGKLAGLGALTLARVAGVACGVALLLCLPRRAPARPGAGPRGPVGRRAAPPAAWPRAGGGRRGGQACRAVDHRPLPAAGAVGR